MNHKDITHSPSYIISWIRSNFHYPNCSKTTNISDLKTGVTTAQILTEIVPQSHHQDILPKIQISKINNVDTCINNWKVILAVLNRITREVGQPHALRDVSPEAIYYRENVLLRVLEFVHRLWQDKQQGIKHTGVAKTNQITYNGTINSHTIPSHQTDVSNNRQEHDDKEQGNKSTKNGSLAQTKKNSIQFQNSQSNQYNISSGSNYKNNYNYGNSNVNLSQLSDIVNLSDVFANEQGRIGYVHEHLQQITDQQPDQDNPNNQYPSINPHYLSTIKSWLSQLTACQPTVQPHEQLGILINNIFSNSRLNDTIIKQAHFNHGALFVYRRILQFLINNPKADKLYKKNVLNLMADIQMNGVVREKAFWLVVGDLYQFCRDGRGVAKRVESSSRNKAVQINSARHKRTTSKNIQHTSNNDPQSQNIPPNIPRQPSQKLAPIDPNKRLYNALDYKYNQQQISNVQLWLIRDLGLEFTVNKIHSQLTLESNPLINGSLMAVLLMRLKIGKIGATGKVQGIAGVRRIWQDIGKLCALRGYQSFKPILNILRTNNHPDPKQLAKIFLHILYSFKQQHHRKNPNPTNTQILTQLKTCNQCPSTLTLKPAKSYTPPPSCQTNSHPDSHQKQVQNSQKLELCKWLSQNFSINLQPNYMPVSKLTDVCREMLSINIYKETTSKIQEKNVEKILGELRRIGLKDYFGVQKELAMGSDDEIRWKILGDLKWVIHGNIQFCRN